MTNTWLYILIMAVVIYAIRSLPLTLIRKPIRSVFVQSFLYYVPYVTLAVMTFPAIMEATQSLDRGSCGAGGRHSGGMVGHEPAKGRRGVLCGCVRAGILRLTLPRKYSKRPARPKRMRRPNSIQNLRAGRLNPARSWQDHT